MASDGEVLLPASGRKFYELPKSSDQAENDDKTSTTPKNETESWSAKAEKGPSLLSYIERNVVGRDKTFSGPYGLREVVYCDYVASGRSLKFIENYIQDEVLPDYGNTHTTTTVTSLQTTLFRHEARDIVRNAVHASEHDAVIFTGAGSTAAIHKLVKGLNFSRDNTPVIFVGPYEHHSTFLPWYDIGADIIRINLETQTGTLDLHHLEVELQKWKPTERPMIGMFSAASNVTGILTDVNKVTIMLHKHGALAFWDYATAGAYVKIDMNPVIASSDQAYVYKDAVFLSPHKFVGGVGTPGLLIAKKKLFQNPTPSGCGGGTVFFVRRTGHRYLQEVEMREEGGTPAIVESVRAGLCFQLKEAVTPEVIMQKEHYFCQKAIEYWKNCPNITILGDNTAERLPIFSFLIKDPTTGLYLHHNFVCSLLNDMFGIQSRGGCACAGPYAQDLLGIDEPTAVRIENLLVEDDRLDRTHLRRYREYSSREILRPGFSRLNFPYFMTDQDFDFVIEAVAMVAEHGWKILPQYIFNPETGEWRHARHQVFKDRKWLGSISYKTGEMTYQEPRFTSKGPLPADRHDALEQARTIFQQAGKYRPDLADQTLMFDGEADALRWFLLPSEAFDVLSGKKVASRSLPFWPGKSVDRVDYNNPEYQKTPVVGSIPTRPTNTDFKTDIETDVGQNDVQKEAFSDGVQKVLEQGYVLDSTPSNGISGGNPSTETTEEVTRNDGETNAPANNDNARECVTCPVKPRTTIDGSNPSEIVCELRKANPKTDSEIIIPATKVKWESPPKKLFHDTVEAMERYSMVLDKDRVLVCLSGGKDSLSLLHILHQYQFYARKKGISFDLGAVTVDPQTASYDPSPLKPYLKALNVPYFYEEQAILEQAANLPYECASICSFCSRMKRGRLYAAARREGYTVLAMGQHLDDLSESLLMNSFHNGVLRTMKANYSVKEGDLRVIRPFIYVREKYLRTFAEERKLPVIAENCPACFEAPKERHRMKQLLANQEILFPRLFPSLRAAMEPLMAISRPGVSVKTAMDNLLQMNGPGDEVVPDDYDDDV